MRRIVALLVFAALALAGPSASAADLPVTPAPKPAERKIIPANDDVNLLADPRCQNWSDGCKTCNRGADGQFACSNPGIACQPRQPTCTGAKAP